MGGVEISIACQICDRMTSFLQPEECLKWVEMAIIVNFAWGYVKLISNVMKALDAAEEGITSALPVSRPYSTVWKQFFADYACVIFLTGSKDKSKMELAMPDGFKTLTIAASLLLLGRQCAHLYERYRDSPWDSSLDIGLLILRKR